jgi:protein transport protein SEC24
LPEELKLLPLLGLALQKSVLFRGGTDVKSDERSALIYRMLTMPVMGSKPFIYPTLLALHRLGGDEGTSDPTSVNSNLVGPDSIIMPPSLPLSVDSLVSDGMFLLFDGVETFIWLGRAAPPSFLEAMFGCSSFEGVDVSYVLHLQPRCPHPTPSLYTHVHTPHPARTYSLLLHSLTTPLAG